MYGEENRGKGKVNQILTFEGLNANRLNWPAGDIVLINGIQQVNIGVTMCRP